MKKAFIKNLLAAIGAQSISMLTSVLVSLLLPKVLGVEQFAYWQLFVLYSGYVGFFHFGLSDGLYLRYGGIGWEKLDRKLIGTQVRIMVCWQFAISILILAVTPIWIIDGSRLFVWQMTAIYLIAANITWCLGYIFQATNRIQEYSKGIIISKITLIFYIGTSILLKRYSFKECTVAFVLGQVLAALYMVIKGRSIIFSKWVPLKIAVKNLIADMKCGINLTISNMVSTLILGYGKIFTDNHWGLSDFGILALSISLINFILQFINQVSMVMFPALRKINGEKQKKVFIALNDSVGILICCLFVLYGPLKSILVQWLPNYKDSFEYLTVMLPICLYDGKMQLLYNTFLKVLRKEKKLLLFNVISFLSCVLLCNTLTKIFDNIFMVVISMLLSVMIRNIVSNIYITHLMKTKVSKGFLLENLLCLLFIVFNLSFDSTTAFLCYLSVVALVIIVYKNRLCTFFRMLKRGEK